MRVHPAIAALRSDRAPQRQAQTAMKKAVESWRADRRIAKALDEFEAFGRGLRLESCPALDEIFTGQDAAERLVGSLVDRFCEALRDAPFGHPPFRNGFDGCASTMLLAKSGRAQLLLQAREPGTYEAPCASFTDAVRFDAVLAGRASAVIARIHGPEEQVRFCDEDIVLERGARLAFDCQSETLLVTEVETRLVALRLLQAPERPRPSREYCRQDGSLVHRSAGSLGTSRREMIVALLGRMGRADAAPVLARLATGEEGDSLRWQALRECLAMDTATGFAALSRLAGDPADSLAGDASALRTALIETHPQLHEWEKSQCLG